MKFKGTDYTGMRFDMVVIDHYIEDPNDPHYGLWEGKCDCGNDVYVRPYTYIQRKHKSPESIISCGCMKMNNRAIRTAKVTQTKIKNNCWIFFLNSSHIDYSFCSFANAKCREHDFCNR